MVNVEILALFTAIVQNIFMPFILISQHPIQRKNVLERCAFVAGWQLDRLLAAMPWLRHLGRPVVMVIALITEIALLWIVIAYLGLAPAPHRAVDNSIPVFALSPAQRPEDPSAQASASVKQQDTAPMQQIQAPITPNTSAPIEWSVARIPVLGNAAPNNETISGAGGNSGAIADAGNGLDGSTGIGGGAYDPYAGASMLPLDRDGSPDSVAGVRINWPTGPDAASWTAANRRALLEWLRMLKKRLPNAQGSVLLKLTADQDGNIMAAQIMGGNAGMQHKRFIANHAKSNLRLPIGQSGEMMTPKIEMER